MDFSIGQYKVENFGKLNVLVGKNGCGKSTFLRQLDQLAIQSRIGIERIRYITPERGGTLIYQGGLDQNVTTNSHWLEETRRKNQYPQFKEQSVSQYRRLETLVLRQMEKSSKRDTAPGFDVYVQKINSLLDNIVIRREDGIAFSMHTKSSLGLLNADSISSGESELITLTIEALIFSEEAPTGAMNLLLIDEPDVHLHPDLQVRLARFLKDLSENKGLHILIATHSTSFLAAWGKSSEMRMGFMTSGAKFLKFENISKTLTQIIPLVGAHPLSNVFNESPILLVEGEDDERIWQQAVRSSRGIMKLHPCVCGSVQDMKGFEDELNRVLPAIYDYPKAFSLRDGDGIAEQIDDFPPVTRMRLQCRSAENLLLSDEVLESLGMTWPRLEVLISLWLEHNQQHPHYNVMARFKSEGYERKQYDLKEIRIDLLGIIGSNKPWEAAVGQVIAKLHYDHASTHFENSIYTYLGEKVALNLFPHKA